MGAVFLVPGSAFFFSRLRATGYWLPATAFRVPGSRFRFFLFPATKPSGLLAIARDNGEENL
jgi:hypothetical protein